MPNGLTLIVIEDASTPLVTVNTLYGVGSRDERPDRTGFAHLFEHLMFGGTPRVSDYDAEANRVGAETNAFTTEDLTNYYITLPQQFCETALWLESDRMRGLAFSQRSLEVQQKVVTEEYNYRYMNRPYGDEMLLLRNLCYTRHPYRWCPIGADIRHVQEATLDDVRAFFAQYYCPANAIVAVSGNVEEGRVVELVDKWYGDIPSGAKPVRQLPAEPAQTAARSLCVERPVPANSLTVAYPMCSRCDDDFAATDLISDLLANGNSSRLYNRLVKEESLFSQVDAYVSGICDPGLFVVSGHLNDGVDFGRAEEAVVRELRRLAEEPLGDRELEKVQNKYENTFVYSQYKASDCAFSACYYEWLGHLDWADSEPHIYRRVTVADIRRVAAALFRPERRNTLYYKKTDAQENPDNPVLPETPDNR